MKLSIGCANNIPEGWFGMDYPFGARIKKQKVLIDYEINLMKCGSFPIQNNSVIVIYSEHCLEHLTDKVVKHTLKECYRILVHKGTIRISVPDFDILYSMYKNDSIGRLCGSHKGYVGQDSLFIFIGEIASPLAKDYKQYKAAVDSGNFNIFTNTMNNFPIDEQEKRPGGHLSWWNYKKLKGLMEDCGFNNVIKTDPGDSKCRDMRGPEFDRTHPEYSLYCEGQK